MAPPAGRYQLNGARRQLHTTLRDGCPVSPKQYPFLSFITLFVPTSSTYAAISLIEMAAISKWTMFAIFYKVHSTSLLVTFLLLAEWLKLTELSLNSDDNFDIRIHNGYLTFRYCFR